MIELLEADKPAAAAAPVIVSPHILAAAMADKPATPGADPAPAAAEPAAAVDPLAEAVGLVEFFHALIIPLYPSLDGVYTPAVRGRLAAVSAPLMAKYGVNLGKLGPEVTFLLTVVPLIQPTIAAIRADRGAAAGTPTAPVVPAAAAAVEEPGAVKLTDRFPGLNDDKKTK